MKSIPQFEVGYTSDKVLDTYGNRFAIRLLQWKNGTYTIGIGQAKKTEGASMPSVFSKFKYTTMPVACLDDLAKYIPRFIELARIKMAENKKEEEAQAITEAEQIKEVEANGI